MTLGLYGYTYSFFNNYLNKHLSRKSVYSFLCLAEDSVNRVILWNGLLAVCISLRTCRFVSNREANVKRLPSTFLRLRRKMTRFIGFLRVKARIQLKRWVFAGRLLFQPVIIILFNQANCAPLAQEARRCTFLFR